MVRLQLIWLGVAAGFLAPAGRQPLLQRRVLMLAAKKVKEPKKGKEAFVPYEISGDSVPMFPLPDRRDAVQARAPAAQLCRPPGCLVLGGLRCVACSATATATARSLPLACLLLASRSPLAHAHSRTARSCHGLPRPPARQLNASATSSGRFRATSYPDAASASASPSPPPPRQAHKKFGDKGVSPSKLAPGALDAHSPSLDLAFPGLRVLHLDPPVLVVDGKHAMCSVHAVCMRCACTCAAHAHALHMHMRCTCAAHALHIHSICTCVAHAGFFSDAECDAYRALEHATDTGDAHKLTQSATFSGASDSRTSTTWFLRYQAVPNLIAAVSALLGAPLEHFEEPQLVRYQAGQMFSWHYDALPPFHPGGQRAATCLVYLNDVDDGGRTAFRDLRVGGTDAEGKPRRVEVAPKKGRALLFFPSFADGTPDERTLHAGEPTAGEKWVAQLWLHHAPYTPNVPEGSSQAAATPAAREYAAERGLRAPP